VQVVSRLRLDAALYARPPRRQPGQKGRPRRRGDRLPALPQLIAQRRHWTALPLVLHGRAVTPRIMTFTARWYGALRAQPVRIVVVRDPSRRRRDEAFCCTDLQQDPAFVLQTYAARWTLENRQPQDPDTRHAGRWNARHSVLSRVERQRGERKWLTDAGSVKRAAAPRRVGHTRTRRWVCVLPRQDDGCHRRGCPGRRTVAAPYRKPAE